ncbi:hypothetical protein L3X38_011016 [Prunus dulcis]|uniref:YDG domain-containing protein n=1 Tax=Prunus dulcis TaxID=3755 RepID=A0AAD4WGR5_PRUDU|nr:hypothetical protein L3X38_011016 [Prunus dulcis]
MGWVCRKKPKDQRLVCENLSLKNSKEEETHVRVIRGFKRFEDTETTNNHMGTSFAEVEKAYGSKGYCL